MAPDHMADAAARLAASAIDQGFPERISDPSVLGRIAAVLTQNEDEREASTPRARRRPKELSVAARSS
jgi:hypothetical protein